MADASPFYLPLTELGRRLRSGELSPVTLTEQFLGRIEALNGKLNAFRLVLKDRAMAQAKAAETALKAGVDLGPLHGQVPQAQQEEHPQPRECPGDRPARTPARHEQHRAPQEHQNGVPESQSVHAAGQPPRGVAAGQQFAGAEGQVKTDLTQPAVM